MNFADTTPPATPPLSPLVMGTSVLVVQTFPFMNFTLSEQVPPSAWATWAMFG